MSIVGTGKTDFWHAFLGISMPKIPICYTINFSPTSPVTSKRKWRELRPSEQYEFLCKYIRNVVYPMVDACYFTFELCKSGELHAHGLCYIQDKAERTEYWVSDLRKRVAQDPRARRLARNNYNAVIRSNYIHKCDNVEEWRKYQEKEADKTPLKGYCCVPVV